MAPVLQGSKAQIVKGHDFVLVSWLFLRSTSNADFVIWSGELWDSEMVFMKTQYTAACVQRSRYSSPDTNAGLWVRKGATRMPQWSQCRPGQWRAGYRTTGKMPEEQCHVLNLAISFWAPFRDSFSKADL